MLVNEADHVRPLLFGQFQVGLSLGPCTIDVCLLDEVKSCLHLLLLDFQCLEVVDTEVALWLPLKIILVKLVVVASRVVQEHGILLQFLYCLVFVELTHLPKQRPLLFSIDDIELALAHRPEVRQQLHAKATREESLVDSLAHLKEKTDACVFLFPWEDVRVALNDHDVHQIEPLRYKPTVIGKHGYHLPFHCACCSDYYRDSKDGLRWSLSL